VLEALLADADTLRRQQPEQYAALQAELPALATELGLAAQEEARSGSPEAGDKQLLLGPVLPGELQACLSHLHACQLGVRTCVATLPNRIYCDLARMWPPVSVPWL
jgi:hypothetical protein